jgi:predicted nucleotidyltransferase
MTLDQIATCRDSAVRRQNQRQQDLSLHQHRGWNVAHQAAKLLQEKFAVTKVALFGSLLHLQKMHYHSDVDLAVWGLSDDRYYQAVAELLDLDSEFSIDLVQVESASPPLQNAILTTGIELENVSAHPITLPALSTNAQVMTPYAPLVGQIRQDLAELEGLIQQSGRLLQKVLETGDEDYLGTIALNIHSFYTSTERIFRDIAQSIDGGLPDGADWHRRLLRQMSAEIPNIRPPVITIETRTALAEYCAFRHVVRNVYTFNLRLDRVQQLARELPNCYQLLRRDCENFCNMITEL